MLPQVSIACLDHVLAAVDVRYRVVVGGRLSARLFDLGDRLVRGPVVVSAAIDVDAGVIHDDLRALGREELRYALADAAAGSGDDRHLAV